MRAAGFGRRLARGVGEAGGRCVLAMLASDFGTALALLALLAPGKLRAADTQWWTCNSQADHAKAESRGVLVDAEGVLRAGPSAQSFATDSLTLAWCAVVLKDGS